MPFNVDTLNKFCKDIAKSQKLSYPIYLSAKIADEIEKINNGGMFYSEDEWKKVIDIYNYSNDIDARYLMIRAIQQAVFPKNLLSKIKTVDEDVMLAMLIKCSEGDEAIAKYLLAVINPKTITNEIQQCKEDKREIPFSYTVTKLCAYEFGNMYDDMLLEFVPHDKDLENFVKNNRLTEKQSTKIINNEEVDTDIKKYCFSHFSYSIDELNEKTPHFVWQDILKSAIETIIDLENKPDKAEKQSQEILYKMAKYKKLTQAEEIKIINLFNRSSVYPLVEKRTLGEIVLNTRNANLLKSIRSSNIYKNKQINSSDMEELITRYIKDLKDPDNSIIQFLSNTVLHQKNLSANLVECIQKHFPSIKNYEPIYWSLVSNPRLVGIKRNEISYHRDASERIKFAGNLINHLRQNLLEYEEIDHIFNTIFRKYYNNDEKRSIDTNTAVVLKRFLEHKFDEYEDEVLRNEVITGIDKLNQEAYDNNLFKRNKIFFVKANRTRLPVVSPTGDALNISKFKYMSDVELNEKLSSLSGYDLKILKNCIEKSIANAKDKVLVYKYLDCYIKLYDKTNELLKEKENAKTKVIEDKDFCR